MENRISENGKFKNLKLPWKHGKMRDGKTKNGKIKNGKFTWKHGKMPDGKTINGKIKNGKFPWKHGAMINGTENVRQLCCQYFFRYFQDIFFTVYVRLCVCVKGDYLPSKAIPNS